MPVKIYTKDHRDETITRIIDAVKAFKEKNSSEILHFKLHGLTNYVTYTIIETDLLDNSTIYLLNLMKNIPIKLSDYLYILVYFQYSRYFIVEFRPALKELSSFFFCVEYNKEVGVYIITICHLSHLYFILTVVNIYRDIQIPCI